MEGTVVGNWKLEEEIGSGGMGAVYLARHQTLDRRAAIKVSSPELAHDPEFRERFQQEARTQSGLVHPHVVPVFDYLEQDGRYFLVSEYAEGGGLDRFLEGLDGPVEIDRATGWTLQALDALDFAHRQGIIHRDVKPSNMVLDGQELLKVTDFGIAVVVGKRRLTRTGVALGTPHYMSPEQIRRPQDVDHRTDVYSVGLVLYELLAGRPAFDGDSDYDLQHAHVHTPPRPPRELNPAVPEALERAVLTALAKEPDDRHVGCGAFARAIEESRSGKEPPDVQEGPPKDPPPEGPKQKNRQWFLVFLLLVAALAILSLLTQAQNRSEEVGRLSSDLAAVRADLERRTAELGENATAAEEREAELQERLAAQQQLLEARGWPIVIADGFTGDQNGWPVGPWNYTLSDETRSIDDGVFQWEGEAKKPFFTTLEKASPTDFYAAVDVIPQVCEDCNYGLSFRRSGSDQYLFRLEGRTASVQRYQNQTWTTLQAPTTVPGLLGEGPKRLEIIGEGPRFHLFINGQPWHSLEDRMLARGNVGINFGIIKTGARAEIHYDNFEIRSKPPR